MDKQELIFQAALRLFVEYGFHGTPTSKIASEAGVSNGTLFHYFKTKDELVVALYIWVKEKMASHIETTIDVELSSSGRLKNMFIAAMYWALENPLEFRFIQQVHTSPYLSMISTEIIEKQTKCYIELFQDAIQNQVIKPFPVDFFFTIITSHIYGVFQYIQMSNFTEGKVKEIISDSFDLLWIMIQHNSKLKL